MDSNYENAWDDTNHPVDSIAMNERYPINNNQPINYSSNDYAETGLESQVNMANGVAVTKLNLPNEMPDICEPPNLAYYGKIWKYMEQIKSIGAGQWWLVKRDVFFFFVSDIFVFFFSKVFCWCRAVECIPFGRFFKCSISIRRKSIVTIGNEWKHRMIRMKRIAYRR